MIDVLEQLDKQRYAAVQDALDQVLAKYGKDLEAVVRTGSSGIRHLEMAGKRSGHSGYNLLISDDDISFVGTKAIQAAEEFNAILAGKGLNKLKVKGFDLMKLRDIRSIDIIALDMVEPEKFLGEAGMARIKQETLQKGAVIAEKSGEGMVRCASPLSAFVESKKTVLEAVKKYGALTAVGSCERQIEVAHATAGKSGWENLTDKEKVKYVLREREALNAAGALSEELNMSKEAIDAEIKQLQAWKANGVPDEAGLQKLLQMREQNVEVAFSNIGKKMQPLIEAAEASGKPIALNPEIRKAINELTTGFALMQDRVIKISEEEMKKQLKKWAGENTTLYDMLFTSFQQSKDLAEAIEGWVKLGGSREGFLDMLLKAEDKLSRIQMVQTRAAAMGVAVGAVALKTMYMAGTASEDLSDAAFALLDVAPGGMAFKRAYTECIDKQTTFLFVKDALYLTPYWGIAAAYDGIEFTVTGAGEVQMANYHDGLVDEAAKKAGGTNCKVDAADRMAIVVTAPGSGEASVACEL